MDWIKFLLWENIAGEMVPTNETLVMVGYDLSKVEKFVDNLPGEKLYFQQIDFDTYKILDKKDNLVYELRKED